MPAFLTKSSSFLPARLCRIKRRERTLRLILVVIFNDQMIRRRQAGRDHFFNAGNGSGHRGKQRQIKVIVPRSDQRADLDMVSGLHQRCAGCISVDERDPDDIRFGQLQDFRMIGKVLVAVQMHVHRPS
jgi:hypothetical protein